PARRPERGTGGRGAGLAKDLSSWQKEATKLSVQFKPGEGNGELVGRLAELHKRIGLVEGRVKQVREQIRAVTGQPIPEDEAARALAAFDPMWGSLTPREQGRAIDLLVERVEYDGAQGTVAVTFRPTASKTLAAGL